MTTLLNIRGKFATENARMQVPAWGVGREAEAVNKQLEVVSAQSRSAPSALSQSLNNPGEPLRKSRTLEERLFDALSDAKVITASVSMHVEKQWRDRLFKQLDRLHDPENWDSGDDPVNKDSFRTFLRMMLGFLPKRRPGLGLAKQGRIVGAWTNGRNRLTIEFMLNDEVRWVLVRYNEENERESAAGQTSLSRLREVLQPYSPSEWFDNGAS